MTWQQLIEWSDRIDRIRPRFGGLRDLLLNQLSMHWCLDDRMSWAEQWLHYIPLLCGAEIAARACNMLLGRR